MSKWILVITILCYSVGCSNVSILCKKDERERIEVSRDTIVFNTKLEKSTLIPKKFYKKCKLKAQVPVLDDEASKYFTLTDWNNFREGNALMSVKGEILKKVVIVTYKVGSSGIQEKYLIYSELKSPCLVMRIVPF